MQQRNWIWLGAMALLLAPVGAFAKDKVKAQSADLAAWIGEWTAGEEQAITITRHGADELMLEGSATYGANDPERVAIGAVNVGSFGGVLPGDWIANGKVSFGSSGETVIHAEDVEDYDCAVEMELAGDELRVEDNGMCGGMNVSFTGVYGR